MNQQIEDLLNNRGIEYRKHGGELLTHCLFNGCDEDSRGNEAHLYINAETGQYICHKCGEKGGVAALKQSLGYSTNSSKAPTKIIDLNKQAQKLHTALPSNISDWLITKRHLNQDDIADALIGYGEFYGKQWVTIPVFNRQGQVQFFKLRQDPFGNQSGAKYMSTGGEASIFNASILSEKPEMLVICEGEFDTLVLKANGVPAISSTAGAATFKDEWIDELSFARTIYVGFDNDEAGDNGAETLIDKLAEHLPGTSIMRIKLPAELGDKADMTDYFGLPTADPGDLFEKYATWEKGIKPVDVSSFKELGTTDLALTLDTTIKDDEVNKTVTFLTMLSAYTADSQLNCSFNAPSSTGKTYIPTEVAQYFPEGDVMEYGGASPTAFYHDGSTYDKERNCYVVNLERKILVFLEQPNPKLQENLRPVLSHDKKEISYKITDKNQRGANRAKHIVVRGYAATIFCSAAMRLDEQEATRAILLSPETGSEKVLKGIHLATLKGTNKAAYLADLEANPERQHLKDRVIAIKQEHVGDIIVPDPASIEKRFLACLKSTKPRNQRDVSHLLSLIKAIALLNVWFRYDENGRVVANQSDVDQGFEVWRRLYESQELNLPPYVYEFYQKYILPLYQEKNDSRNPDFVTMTGYLGVTRRDLNARYYKVEGHLMNSETVNRQILPMLETAGVIRQERDPEDKRSKVIYALLLPGQNNTVLGGGTGEEGDIE